MIIMLQTTDVSWAMETRLSSGSWFSLSLSPSPSPSLYMQLSVFLSTSLHLSLVARWQQFCQFATLVLWAKHKNVN